MFPNISPNTPTSFLNAAFRVLSRLSDAMCSDSKLSRLCRLDDDFLRPYTESGVVLVAQESEVLVTLSGSSTSQALDSENVVAIGLDCKSDCMCPTKIVTHLMVLLTVEGPYVKHLACNVLVAVSEFLVTTSLTRTNVIIDGILLGFVFHLLVLCVF
ncbi:hypothetical protein ACFX11_038459 [Malus domestica]